ncbi:MAG: transketolase [Bacteroidetes bacterium]|nr:MAG: transketolase [Bacteroidota bacterium]
MISDLELEKIAVAVRQKTLEIIFKAGGGHTGGSLSSADILVTLYHSIMNIDPKNPLNPDRDRFILSKGHSVESLYAVLASRGFISDEALKTYGQFNSILAGHPTIKVPGIELNSGALGHGLSVGVGMAMAAKRSTQNFKVYVLMGDGEQGEGSVMEAAAAAGHYHLDNMVAIVDRNQLQISGPTEEVCKIDDLAAKYTACGWSVTECDGHSVSELIKIFSTIPFDKDKPSLIIAHTIKGKGVSFIENQANWHHKVPTEEQFKMAYDELDKKMEELNHAR